MAEQHEQRRSTASAAGSSGHPSARRISSPWGDTSVEYGTMQLQQAFQATMQWCLSAGQQGGGGAAAAAGRTLQHEERAGRLSSGMGVPGGAGAVPEPDLLRLVSALKLAQARRNLAEQAIARAPCYCLSPAAFMLMCDLCRAAAREANNCGDFESVALFFNISALYAVSVSGCLVRVRRQLLRHEAWSNVVFWNIVLEDLVRSDLKRWDLGSRSHLAPKLMGVDNRDLLEFSIVLRVKALCKSMHFTMRPKEFQQDFAHNAAQICHVEHLLPILHHHVSLSVVLWMLDTICILLDEGQLRVDTVKGGLLSQRSAQLQLGYTPILELMFDFVKIFLSHLDGTLDTRVPKKTCYCGAPLGRWKALGIVDMTLEHRKHLPWIMCELCFRETLRCCGSLRATTSIQPGLELFYCPVPSRRPMAPSGTVSDLFTREAEPFSADIYIPDHEDFIGRPSVLGVAAAASGAAHAGGQPVASSTVSPTSSKFHTPTGPRGRKSPAAPAPAAAAAAAAGGGGITSRRTSQGSDSDGEWEYGDGDEGGDDMMAAELDIRGSTIEALELQRARALEAFLRIMMSGVDVVKHGRMGRPKTRTVFISQDGGRLCWIPPGREALVPSQKGFIAVDDITQIKVPNTKPRNRICLITPDRSLTLQTDDTEIFNTLVNGFLLLCEAIMSGDYTRMLRSVASAGAGGGGA